MFAAVLTSIFNLLDDTIAAVFSEAVNRLIQFPILVFSDRKLLVISTVNIGRRYVGR